MHWVGSQDGGIDAERELILSQQTPGEIVFLSAADTDLAAVAATWGPIFGDRLRLSHAAPLRQPVAADHFVQTVVRGSRILIARLLGGEPYFRHLLQALDHLREDAPRPALLLFSSTQDLEEELTRLTDFDSLTSRAFQQLFAEGGAHNLTAAAQFWIAWLSPQAPDTLQLPAVQRMPACGWYRTAAATNKPAAWITFYRALYQTADLEVVDALVEALEARGLAVCAFYCQSLKDTEPQQELLRHAKEHGSPDVILTMQSFAIGSATETADGFPSNFGCPVLQVPVSVSPRTIWQKNPSGLAPAETAIQIALPEIDGRVLSSVAGFKEDAARFDSAECTLKRLRPEACQIDFIAQLATNWTRLRYLSNKDKKIAIILANYPNKDGRIGNGVGLDTPASAIEILKALASEGYHLPEVPASPEHLMRNLLHGVTNDSFANFGKAAEQSITRQLVTERLSRWPSMRFEEVNRHWPDSLPDIIPVAGLQLGNIFIGIQPPRGFSMQTQAAYHSPDLAPPPQYFAFYLWVRECFKADAIVHLGKHGNLEWLPGRAAGLGPDDYPQMCLGPTPHLYPFIVNNPGEGTQAKRRTSAVIIDHLTPPLTRAGLYGQLETLERLLEEHTHSAALYPRRAAELEKEMETLLSNAPWRRDLPEGGTSLPALANFLCELKESQIRSGLHIFGRDPTGENATDFILSLVRLGAKDRPSLPSALHGSEVVMQELSAFERDRLDQRARSWISDLLAGKSTPRILRRCPAFALLFRARSSPF